MTRRELLLLAVTGVLGSGLIASGFGWPSRFAVRARIRRRLGDWEISNAQLDDLLDAVEAVYGKSQPEDDNFLRVLILSTDAFRQGRTDQVLAFTSVYHPYENPCTNPLARH